MTSATVWLNGELTILQALCHSKTRTVSEASHEYDIFSSTYGIMFFGTPHLGSSKAAMLMYLKSVVSIASPVSRSKSHLALVSALKEESEVLANENDFFMPLMRTLAITFFWETQKTDIPLIGKDYIVPVESAAPPYEDAERAGIPASHNGMVKFEQPSDPGFRIVLGILARYCEEAPAVVARKQTIANDVLTLSLHEEAMQLMQSTVCISQQRPANDNWQAESNAGPECVARDEALLVLLQSRTPARRTPARRTTSPGNAARSVLTTMSLQTCLAWVQSKVLRAAYQFLVYLLDAVFWTSSAARSLPNTYLLLLTYNLLVVCLDLLSRRAEIADATPIKHGTLPERVRGK